jgi:hypothetical protein
MRQLRKGEFHPGGIDSRLLFRFVLILWKDWVFDGAEEFVLLLLFEIDFEELLFIPIPEKVAKLVGQVPNFESDPDFLLIFHFSPHSFGVL